MLIAPLETQTAYTVQEQGPAAVYATSSQTGSDTGTKNSSNGNGASTASGSSTQSSGTQIVGTSPSLSTSVIGSLGGSLGETEDEDDETTSSLTVIDPLTGKPMEIDPITGEPIPATPLSVALDKQAERAASGLSEEPDATADGRSGETLDMKATIAQAMEAEELSPEQQAEVARLEAADQQVRAHESAHEAAGPGVTGPATFTYITGPDGRPYAVGGEVPITTTASATDPEQVADEMEQVRDAALAPADASPADHSVAASAQAAQARAEQALRVEETEDAANQAETGDGVPAWLGSAANDDTSDTADEDTVSNTTNGLTGTNDPATADAMMAAQARTAFVTATAAYGQTADLLTGAPTASGNPFGVVEPQSLLSLVA